MARAVKDKKLDSANARANLKAQGKPYFRALDIGLHLGYRRGKTGGTWVMRRYVGEEAYETKTIGTADDHQAADGDTILSFSQAQERARNLAKESRAPSPVAPLTVNRALDEYFAALEAEHSKSLKDARNRAKNHIRPALGEKLVAELTTADLTKWRNAIAAKPRTVRGKKGKAARALPAPENEDQIRRRRATANRCFTVLRAALNHAFRDSNNKLESDKAWRATKPFREVEAARVHYISVAEAQRLVNAAQGDFKALVNAALLTGARYGELCRLRVRDFNPDSGTLFVERSKSGKARHVVLTDEGREFFAGLTAGRASDDLLVAHDDGSAWGASHQLRPMREACDVARIKQTGFHTLRHTYASLLTMAGAPLNVVAQNLGHADTRMCEKHYAHLAPSYVAETIRKFAPTFGTVEKSNVAPIACGRG